MHGILAVDERIFEALIAGLAGPCWLPAANLATLVLSAGSEITLAAFFRLRGPGFCLSTLPARRNEQETLL
jgi:hypothetical protein